MKSILVALLAAALLTGCVTSHDREIQLKKNLCVQFGLVWQEFIFSGMDKTDVICLDEKTGERVYVELIPERKVRK